MPTKGTPSFNVRLSPASQAQIAQMARIYGSPNTRAFARELLETMCSGNEAQVSAFLGKLFERLTGQLRLDLETTTHAKRTKRTKRRKRT